MATLGKLRIRATEAAEAGSLVLLYLAIAFVLDFNSGSSKELCMSYNFAQ